MPESLGARLRRQREQRQIQLSTIAEQSKISVALLQGLEEDDVSRWPTGIFRRAFVRTYAAAIGLEPEGVVREFLEMYPDPAESIAVPGGDAAANGGSNDNGVPPGRFRFLVGSALGSLGGLQSIGRWYSNGASTGPTSAADCPATPQSGGSGTKHATSPGAPAVDAPVTPAPSGDVETPATDTARVDVAVEREVDASDTSAPSGDVETPATDTRHVDVAVEREPSVQADTGWNPDVSAAAQLCTDFGRVENARELTGLLARAARILGAAGLIVWVRDSETDRLWPALAHGYAKKVLAHVSPLRCDENNATTAAFRTEQTSIMTGSNVASGAVVVPLLARAGCVGVLAIEFRDRTEQNQLVRALATIFAALLAGLVVDARFAIDRERRLA
jgi:helix-turn-helix protein/GAF domain-containing protein